MESQILNKNIVIIGEFKPSTFDKLFFIKKNLLKEEDFLETSIFLPDLTIIETESYQIEIDNNRFTINYKMLNYNEVNKLLNLESVLDGSNVIAFGFNIKIDLFIQDKSETKKYFYFKDNVLNKYFESNDTAYGYYISKDLDSCRMKLDIKPVQLQKLGENKILEAIDFNFNFHFQNSDYKTQLNKYADYEKMTLEIINCYE